MPNPVRPLLIALICLSPASWAESSIDWKIDADASSTHQNFEDSSATLRTLTLVPSAQWGNWDFTLSLPWVSATGDYFVGAGQPTPQLICRRIARLSPALLAKRIAKGRFTQEQVDTCQAQAASSTTPASSADHSGIGDVDLFGAYNWSLDDNWLLSLGAGYKLDTGDADIGLGSGTQESRLEASVIYTWQDLTATAIAGESLITQAERNKDALEHYGYGSLALDYALLESLSLGASYHYQQSYYPKQESPSWLTASLTYRPLRNMSLSIAVTDYGDLANYPEREWTAGLGYGF